MTHEPESGFDVDVQAYLETTFPNAGIQYQPRLATQRVPDFLVTFDGGDGPDMVLVVECENDFEGVIGGASQAEMYAGHFNHGIPAVALPEDHTETPECDYLRRQSSVLFLEVPEA